MSWAFFIVNRLNSCVLLFNHGEIAKRLIGELRNMKRTIFIWIHIVVIHIFFQGTIEAPGEPVVARTLTEGMTKAAEQSGAAKLFQQHMSGLRPHEVSVHHQPVMAHVNPELLRHVTEGQHQPASTNQELFQQHQPTSFHFQPRHNVPSDASASSKPSGFDKDWTNVLRDFKPSEHVHEPDAGNEPVRTSNEGDLSRHAVDVVPEVDVRTPVAGGMMNTVRGRKAASSIGLGQFFAKAVPKSVVTQETAQVDAIEDVLSQILRPSADDSLLKNIDFSKFKGHEEQDLFKPKATKRDVEQNRRDELKVQEQKQQVRHELMQLAQRSGAELAMSYEASAQQLESFGSWLKNQHLDYQSKKIDLFELESGIRDKVIEDQGKIFDSLMQEFMAQKMTMQHIEDILKQHETLMQKMMEQSQQELMKSLTVERDKLFVQEQQKLVQMAVQDFNTEQIKLLEELQGIKRVHTEDQEGILRRSYQKELDDLQAKLKEQMKAEEVEVLKKQLAREKQDAANKATHAQLPQDIGSKPSNVRPSRPKQPVKSSDSSGSDLVRRPEFKPRDTTVSQEPVKSEIVNTPKSIESTVRKELSKLEDVVSGKRIDRSVFTEPTVRNDELITVRSHVESGDKSIVVDQAHHGAKLVDVPTKKDVISRSSRSQQLDKSSEPVKPHHVKLQTSMVRDVSAGEQPVEVTVVHNGVDNVPRQEPPKLPKLSETGVVPRKGGQLSDRDNSQEKLLTPQDVSDAMRDQIAQEHADAAKKEALRQQQELEREQAAQKLRDDAQRELERQREQQERERKEQEKKDAHEQQQARLIALQEEEERKTAENHALALQELQRFQQSVASLLDDLVQQRESVEQAEQHSRIIFEQMKNNMMKYLEYQATTQEVAQEYQEQMSQLLDDSEQAILQDVAHADQELTVARGLNQPKIVNVPDIPKALTPQQQAAKKLKENIIKGGIAQQFVGPFQSTDLKKRHDKKEAQEVMEEKDHDLIEQLADRLHELFEGLHDSVEHHGDHADSHNAHEVNPSHNSHTVEPKHPKEQPHKEPSEKDVSEIDAQQDVRKIGMTIAKAMFAAGVFMVTASTIAPWIQEYKLADSLDLKHLENMQYLLGYVQSCILDLQEDQQEIKNQLETMRVVGTDTAQELIDQNVERVSMQNLRDIVAKNNKYKNVTQDNPYAMQYNLGYLQGCIDWLRSEKE